MPLNLSFIKFYEFGDTLDKEAYEYFDQVITNSKTLYKRAPF